MKTSQENNNQNGNDSSGLNSANQSRIKKSLPIIIGILLLATLIYGVSQWNKNHRSSSDYGLTEIDNLQEEQQRKILEDQLKDAQKQLESLPENAVAADHYTAYIRLAELQNRLGMYQDAIASVDKIAASQQGNSRVWLTYAESYKGLGDYEKAKINVANALRIDDEVPEPWRVYIKISQDLPADQLNALYVEALTKTKNDLDLVISYAKFLEANGDIPKAVAYWETARNKNPDGAADYEREIARLRPPQQ